MTSRQTFVVRPPGASGKTNVVGASGVVVGSDRPLDRSVVAMPLGPVTNTVNGPASGSYGAQVYLD